MNLYAILIDTGQHKYNAVCDFGNALAKLTLYFGCDWADVHDRLGVNMTFVRIDHIECKALAKRILLDRLIHDRTVDRNLSILDRCRISNLHIGDLNVLFDQGADHLFDAPVRSRLFAPRQEGMA